ncbi:MAG TPA: methyltransferase domain-containing protein [Actinomycetota bacterium]|nr:methyltransferase domain-containing protein [Actinomycetota bacterium]
MPLFGRRPSRPARLRLRTGTGGRGPLAGQADWRAYDAVAAEYARVHAPRMDLVARDLVAAVGLPQGARVLDVGTGTGVAARRAAEGAGSEGLVVGVDASLPMLEEAARAGGGPRYVAAEAIDLPFGGGAFDAVLASFVLAHFANHETALDDMVRVLVPGGRLGVTAWGPEEDEFSQAWQEVAEEFASREILLDARRQATPGADRFADRERLREALAAAGLREVRVERREYRFVITAEEYLVGREISPTGRFLREMLGEALWERFRRRAREAFARRFPPRFNDFRDVNLAVGTKPRRAAPPEPWPR